ncbi:MAG TPA: helix-turn-helix domain-containing protein [Acidobacteriaceae bacterium]|jgi:excisionase family DNA binding protein|nr:helix-turn-helix domain-containing protein [Acidobacteriaceae bacterium]
MKTTPPKTEVREVLDIRQAADYLGISPDTLYKYASDGFVPAFKLGNRWRFKRSRLDEWMDLRSTPGSTPEAQQQIGEDRPDLMGPKKPQPVRPRSKKTVRAIR